MKFFLPDLPCQVIQIYNHGDIFPKRFKRCLSAMQPLGHSWLPDDPVTIRFKQVFPLLTQLQSARVDENQTRRIALHDSSPLSMTQQPEPQAETLRTPERLANTTRLNPTISKSPRKTSPRKPTAELAGKTSYNIMDIGDKFTIIHWPGENIGYWKDASGTKKDKCSRIIRELNW